MMNPLDFLGTADRLMASPEESDLRTSIGRSYYAIFNYSVERISPFVATLPDGPEAHQAVQHYFRNVQHNALKQVGQTLRNLRTSRNDADYRMSISVTFNDAALALQRAKRAQADLGGVAPTQLQSFLRSVPSYPGKSS